MEGRKKVYKYLKKIEGDLKQNEDKCKKFKKIYPSYKSFFKKNGKNVYSWESIVKYIEFVRDENPTSIVDESSNLDRNKC